jgi:glycosyltransferase involved in cell wall biosynthesis
MSDHLGVTALGAWEATSGIAEYGRRTVAALVAAGVDVTLTNIANGAGVDRSRLSPLLAALPRDIKSPISISFLNINEQFFANDSDLRPVRSSYVVAMWHWEVPSVPVVMRREIDRVDEIWVSSIYSQRSLSRYTDKPIIVVPSVIEPKNSREFERKHFGIPEDAGVTYLFTFDAHSTFARKNPFAVIEAFRQAFTEAEMGHGATLVVKAIHLDSYPDARERLRREVLAVKGVLLEHDMSGDEVAGLLQSADVYVSLHRSEGFGLGMAEAMYFGTPVIATAHSGNMDYMNSFNSCPVGYQSSVISSEVLAYNPRMSEVYEYGNVWADPNVEDAAAWMRWLYEDESRRVRIGLLAASMVAKRYSLKAVGEVLRERLEIISSSSNHGEFTEPSRGN